MQPPRAQTRRQGTRGVDVSSEREVEWRAIGGARRCGRCFVTGLGELAKHVSGFEGFAQF